MNHTRYTEEDLLSSLYNLVDRLTYDNLDIEIDYIVGISRGGLVPAVYLSHLLGDIPMVCINPKQVVLDIPEYSTILLVDEISDTGNVFNSVLSEINPVIKVKTLSLHCRYSSKYIPDYYDVLIPNDNWIDYPWNLNP